MSTSTPDRFPSFTCAVIKSFNEDRSGLPRRTSGKAMSICGHLGQGSISRGWRIPRKPDGVPSCPV